MCDCLKLNLGSFCHLMMNDWADPHANRTIDGQGVLEPIPLSFAGVAQVGDQPQHILHPAER